MQQLSSLPRHASLLIVLILVAQAACECGGPVDRDGGPPDGGGLDSGVTQPPADAGRDSGPADSGALDDGGLDDGGFDDGGFDAGIADGGLGDGGADSGSPSDSGEPEQDAGGDARDGGPPDASVEPRSYFPLPTVTSCPGDSLPPPTSGRCEVTSGGAAMLLTGDVLTPGEVLRGGQVLVDDTGTIACVACDCSGAPEASAATEVVCPDVVISPGLINGHDHVTFAGAWPYGDTRMGGTDRMTEERYEHRHDWRDGLDGHTRIPSLGGTSSTMKMQWLEWRQLLSGTTSIFGSGGPDGFLRNLDSDTRNGLSREGGTYQTFPLGDAVSGLKLYDSCEYAGCSGTDCFERESELAFVPHVAEGIDRYARNELLCLSTGDRDVNEPQSAFIHGVGVLPLDMAQMAEDEVELIWSPRTNITLYGETARVTEYAKLGVTIGLGTDWVATGSMNMLRELACADTFNQHHLDRFFSDEQLWLMATLNSARALRVDDVLGALAVGSAADLALYDATTHKDHRAVLLSRPEDVVLVTISGDVKYGDAAVVDAIKQGCELMPDVCGEEKRACLSQETCYPGCTAASGSPTPCSYALLRACGDEDPTTPQYPLYFCGEPADEPSCTPARTSMGPLPDASVNGSNYYDGMSSLDDVDGDGIENDVDSCPSIFNPIRPLDNGAQADFDEDGLGDACDPCPLGGDDDPETCNILPHLDLDRDGISRNEDVCPAVADPLQEDADEDGIGDACDPCPLLPTPRGSQTVYSARCGGVETGEWVTLHDMVVTAVTATGFFAQRQPGSADYTGVEYSGIFVSTGTAPAESRGDMVEVIGRVHSDEGLVQLLLPTVTVFASAPEPSPVVVDPLLIATGGESSLALASALVRVDEVTATDTWAGGEFVVDDVLLVSGELFAWDPPPGVGEEIHYLQGPLAYAGGESSVLLRDAADVGFTTFRLSPAQVEVRVGRPLTFIVSLPFDAPLGGVLVTFTQEPEGFLDGPESVLVPAGDRHASADFVAGVEDGDGALIASYEEVSSASAVSVVTEASLIFSEYVEGLGSNKALEIANIGGSPADLSTCSVRLYTNGSATPSSMVTLEGTLAAGAQYVLCNAGTDNAETRCHTTSATINHNGDDAYDLVCLGLTVDTFGRLGERPTAPSAWTGGGLSTLDYVLKRRCDVIAGDVDGADVFVPSVEWTGEPWESPALSLVGLKNLAECP